MSHFETVLKTLKRPRLLIRAASLGARRYNRARHLKMLATTTAGKTRERFFKELIEKERDMDWVRRSGSADYNVQKHVLILSALIVEARLPA